MHVGDGDAARQQLAQTRHLGFEVCQVCQVNRRIRSRSPVFWVFFEVNHEMDLGVGTRVDVRLDGAGFVRDKLLQGLLEVVGPDADRKLLYRDHTARRIRDEGHGHVEAGRHLGGGPNRAAKPVEPGNHRDQGFVAAEKTTDVGEHVERVVTRDVRAETGSDPGAPVDQHEREYRGEPLGLNANAVLGVGMQHRVVVGMEENVRLGGQVGEDVTRARRVFTPHEARTELAFRREQTDVVPAADERLREVHDGAHQALFAVMVQGFGGHVSAELRDLDFLVTAPLASGVDDLPLTRLESVHEMWNRAHVVVPGELDELLVHKVVYGHGRGNRRSGRGHRTLGSGRGRGRGRAQPTLAVVGTGLSKRELHRVAARVVGPIHVLDKMAVESTKVLPRLVGGAGTEPFVVFDRPHVLSEFLCMCAFGRPSFELFRRVESLGRAFAFTMGTLEDRSAHGCDEVRHVSQEGGPKVVQEVENQAFDVGPVDVRVGQNHDVPVAQGFGVGVRLAGLQSEDALQVTDLFVLRQLVDGGVAHVDELTA
eukprot:265988-Prorocentrum_minimum.AAC.15